MATNFKGTRRSQVKVFPSGVEVEMQNLIGAHQAMITNSDDKQRKNALNNILLDCCKRIGEKTTITMKDIEKLLSNDRAYFLFELRMFSNRLSPNFTFDYEFPVDKNGSKRKQRFEVIFDRADFPQRPYKWVQDKMVADYTAENNINQELTDDLIEKITSTDFPILYQDYDQMLEENLEQTVTLPDSQCEVTWTLLQVASEDKYATGVAKRNFSSHDQLLQRNPKYQDGETEVGKPLPALPLNDLSQDDIETLRNDIVKTEGLIDTSVVVQYKDDVTTATKLNLVSVPAFFFPSLAN